MSNDLEDQWLYGSVGKFKSQYWKLLLLHILDKESSPIKGKEPQPAAIKENGNGTVEDR